MAAKIQQSDSQDVWTLYYWPSVKGRGEYVRLCFEEAGVPYQDAARSLGGEAPPWTSDSVSRHPGFRAVVQYCFDRGADGTHAPVRAPPVIARGGFALGNTPAILSFLNEEFGWGEGLGPEGRGQVAHILSVVLSDAVAEGRLAFHPKDFYASHKTQVEDSKPYIEQYGEKRLPKYIEFLEATLRWNNEQRPGAVDNGFLVGPSLTAADLAAWHYLCALEVHFAQWYAPAIAGAPRLEEFKERIAGRPRIRSYLASGRCPPWDTDSLM